MADSTMIERAEDRPDPFGDRTVAIGSGAPKRRRLNFDDVGSMLNEVDRLHADGYECLGRWDLGRICRHLARSLHATIDGAGPVFPRALVVTVGPLLKRMVMWTGRIPSGATMPKGVEPGPEGVGDPESAIAELHAAVARFGAHRGALHAHPAFGPMSPEEWGRFHLIHAAHHLGFLVPRVGDEHARRAMP